MPARRDTEIARHKFFSSAKARSEYEFGCQLHDPRNVGNCDLAELRDVSRGDRRSAEQSAHAADAGAETVRKIEGFSADFEGLALTDTEAAGESHIDFPGIRSRHARAAQISKSAGLDAVRVAYGVAKGKRRRVQPRLARRGIAANGLGIGGQRIGQQ